MWLRRVVERGKALGSLRSGTVGACVYGEAELREVRGVLGGCDFVGLLLLLGC